MVKNEISSTNFEELENMLKISFLLGNIQLSSVFLPSLEFYVPAFYDLSEGSFNLSMTKSVACYQGLVSS